VAAVTQPIGSQTGSESMFARVVLVIALLAHEDCFVRLCFEANDHILPTSVPSGEKRLIIEAQDLGMAHSIIRSTKQALDRSCARFSLRNPSSTSQIVGVPSLIFNGLAWLLIPWADSPSKTANCEGN
jgi:hypothetical protein